MAILKTLFGKLLIINICIILAGFIILGFSMSKTLENYFIQQKQDLLVEQAKIIESQYLTYFESGIVDIDRLAFELEALDRYLDARIWILNRRGQVYINSGQDDLTTFIKDLEIDEIQEVFQGKILKREGTFKGFFQQPVLTIGYPIKTGNQVVLGLFIHSSIPEILKTTKDIRRITLISLVISSLIAFILVFLTSRNLTQEISRINDGVGAIAKGNFNKKLEINREDELGELAKNLNIMADDLKKLETMRRDFISNISHDLRTPLTSINGFVKGILDGTIEKKDQEEYLNIVLEESQRLTKLTNNILDLSKIEGGQLNLEITPFDINQLILNEIDKFERRIKEKDLQIDLNLEREKFIAYGDISGIERVLYNLFDNGVKFTENGGKIYIKTRYKDNRVFISVRNTGSVISKEDLKYIFDRFNKLDSSRGKDREGSGLGLSIVKEIIRLHNQGLNVSSSREKGVEFTFTLDGEKL